MGSNYLGISTGRKPGVLLPKVKPEEGKPSECKRYFIDKDKYAEEGIVEQISEAEEYKAPDESWSTFDLPTTNPIVIENRRAFKMSRNPNKPSKEQLAKDMETMSLRQLGKHYDVHSATVSYWIREYGLQRKIVEKKGMPVVEEVAKYEVDEVASVREFEVVVEVNGVEEVDTLPEKEQPVKRRYQEIWDDVALDLSILRKMYHDQADLDFKNDFNRLTMGLNNEAV